jgi:glycosyltransferase involved in cell wall biosynthesis
VSRKVLIANSHIPWGGLGQYSVNLARSLSKAGYEVYGLVTHNNENLFDEFSDATIKTWYLGGYGKLKKYYKCIRTINTLKPDFIIVNYLATVQFILPLLRKAIIISVIHSNQDDYYRIASINKPFINLWIAPSSGVKTGFIHYLRSNRYNEKISIIPHGVDVGNSPIRGKNTGTFNIAFVGSLYEHKGVGLLPEIFFRFHNQCPDSNLVIIGEGEMDQLLKEKFKSYNIGKDVDFTGVLENHEVRESLAKADVLLFPTRIESFGLVIIESMMEGAVPVVSELKGITDMIVKDKEDGFLVDKDNIVDFADRLVILYEDRDLLQKMSLKAKEKANSVFRTEIMAEMYSKMILSLIEK